MNIFWKCGVGIVLPSAAAIVFNIFHFFFENYKQDTLPPMSESVWDVAVGCAFSLIGVGVTMKAPEKVGQTAIVFAVLILGILAGELLVPVFFHLEKLYPVLILNFISSAALAWAIVQSEVETSVLPVQTTQGRGSAQPIGRKP